MPKLIILGSSTNIPDIHHENSHMVLVGDDHMILIDGPGNPFVRLREAGLDERKLTDIIMTHFHPDHVSGIPLLLMAVGLSGREDLLDIYANKHCLALMQKLLGFYEWESWHSFPVEFHTIREERNYLLMEVDGCKIFTSPVKHFIPTVGLRFEFPNVGKVLAYSCDTAPTPSLIDLGKDADIFIHEAAGESPGHSSARQAGEIASEANAKSLYLIHYPTGEFNSHILIEEAAQAYNGPIALAEDFMEFDF
jgi:ribonuclease Z